MDVKIVLDGQRGLLEAGEDLGEVVEKLLLLLVLLKLGQLGPLRLLKLQAQVFPFLQRAIHERKRAREVCTRL